MTAIAVAWKGLDAVVLLEAGVERRGDGVRVPYRDASGAEHNAKLFSRTGNWWERRGVDLIPFGLDQVAQPADRANRRLWIAEGESDALALREHYAGWRGKPVDVIGLPGASTWRDEWARHLHGYAAAHCFPDGDEAGERMADRIASSVRWIHRVRLPAGRDVRSILQGDGPDALDEQITRAEWCSLMWAGMRLCKTLPELEQFLAEVTW